MRRAYLWIAFIGLLAPIVLGVPQADRRGLNLIVVTTQAEAATLRNRARAGESFELLAMRYSIGPAAEEGGYTVSLRPGDLRQELETALARLKPGEMSAIERLGGMFFLLRRSTRDEENWRSQYTQGLLALQQRRYPEAVQAFSVSVEEAMKFTREDQRVALGLQGLSQSYRLQKDYEHAEPPARRSLALFERLLGPEHPGVIPSLENLAKIQLSREEYAEAAQEYRRVLAMRWSGTPSRGRADPMEILENLSAVLTAAYFRDSQLEEAFRELDQAIGRAAIRENLYDGIAQGLFRVDLVAEAETVLRRGIQAFPESRQIHYGLAKVYVQASKYAAALGEFETANRLQGPLDPAADRQQRGVIYERIGSMNTLLVRFDDALAAYRAALELTPDNLKARLALADLQFRRGTLNEALDEYTRAISKYPESAAAHHGLAETYLHLDRYAESVRAAQKALELDPGDRGSRYIQALALVRSGRTEEGQAALQEYERLEAQGRAEQKRQRTVLELDRNAAMKLIDGQSEEAIAMWRKTLDSAGGTAVEDRLYMNLAVAQVKLKRHRDAAQTFQAMIDRGMDDFLVNRNLAIEYELLGDSRFVQQRAIYLEKYNAALKVISN
jgi:tetratricopeptide (TPR) repeat protein